MLDDQPCGQERLFFSFVSQFYGINTTINTATNPAKPKSTLKYQAISRQGRYHTDNQKQGNAPE